MKGELYIRRRLEGGQGSCKEVAVSFFLPGPAYHNLLLSGFRTSYWRKSYLTTGATEIH